MKYTDLMAIIDEKFNERDEKIKSLVKMYHILFNQGNEIKAHLEAIDRTLDRIKDEAFDQEYAEDESDNDECENETCDCGRVDIEEEIKKFLQGFAYKPKKKD